ncbi:MAG: ATP-binding protein [Bacteroides sp.]|nr:ATP-binding protein [Roseburia sp.]MCM1346396.1 ATP-binding protein [Bacteroides sp.]MCM1421791.1 ATP-binding protein [Bacteroides sp.]
MKQLFFILAALVAAIGALLFILLRNEGGLMFYMSETLVLACLLFMGYFYRKVVRSFDIIAGGMDLLKEQDFSSRLAPVGQKETDRVVQVFNRMMDRLKNERLRLREQNHFLDLLISSSPMGVVILDFDGAVTLVNDAALRFLGYASADEIAGVKVEQMTTPLAVEIARIPQDGVDTVRLSDSCIYRCSRLSFVDRGFAHPFILIESLTSEVVKAEKKAYEKVVRMIAHEVNNTVAGITSTLDMMKDVAAENGSDAAGDAASLFQVCIDRCYGMSRFITRFADVVKLPQPQPRRCDLNACVTSCKLFMDNICTARDISLQLNLCEDVPWANIDSVLFEQVLVNIIKNSAESIGRAGHIVITTSAAPATIEVRDDGAGISREAEAKLFSPFFSTKPHGQGIGLVLIREVLTGHGCRFSLRTYADGLTRFVIVFPAVAL